jgi:glutamate-1-semialdehyde 2,1-aminomutase
LYEEASRHLVGGLSAAARFNPALGRPFFAARGEGARVIDVDGRTYIDMNTSFGAALLGYGHPAITAAIREAASLGVLCAFETEYQSEVATRISEMVPSAELVRFTNTGTETVWHAIRTARTFTGRQKIVKFEGHFHGYSDVIGYSMWPPLSEAGPAEAPNSVPQSGGMPPAGAADVIVLPWNDLGALEQTIERHGPEIAVVVMEPINYNSGTLMPMPGYLEGVRELTRAHGIVLLFDEILSGFRTGPSCAQGYLGITPDMCTLGKCLGGGTVLSAFAGRRDVMGAVAPLGPAVHSGTFNANLVPILAGRAFLQVVGEPAFWAKMDELENHFHAELRAIFERSGERVRVQAVGARFSMLFGLDREPHDYRDVAGVDRARETAFYAAALERGVYFHYSWHHGFSAMHTRVDLDEALGRIEDAARSMQKRRPKKATTAAAQKGVGVAASMGQGSAARAGAPDA